MRIGLGYDVHALELGETLILGGINIPYEYGLKGHSDADVLVHAIMDGLLGAAALGDIGFHFPPTDMKYKGADSVLLLEHVVDLIKDQGLQIGNIDSTIVAQAPKLRPYIDDMRNRLAEAMKINISQINIKATTEEGLGFTGRKEGISSYAICLLV